MSMKFPNRINILFGDADVLDIESFDKLIYYPCSHALPNEKLKWVRDQFENHSTFTQDISIVTNDMIILNALEVFLHKYGIWDNVGLYIIQDEVKKVSDVEEIYSLIYQTLQDLENIEWE